MAYPLLADLLLFAHLLFALFVVLGLALVVAGGALGWRWVRNRAFRVAHLAAIGVVALQSWLGVVCPLTTFEMWARRRAGERVYAGSFIAHWIEELLYYEAPTWVFVTVYSLFTAAVLVAWVRIPPAS